MSTTTAPSATSVRAGDRDRERTANQLGQALAQGYLAMDEYEARLQATFAAHTTPELRQHLAHPAARAAPPQRSAAPGRATPRGTPWHANSPRRISRDGRHRAHRVA